MISYYMPRRRFSTGIFEALQSVFTEKEESHKRQADNSEETKIEAEDFAQLSREEQLKVNNFGSILK